MKQLAALLFVALLAAPGLARGDAAPPLDPYEVCEGKPIGSYCTDGYYDGACIEKECPNEPMMTCRYCEDNAEPTTTAGSTSSDDTMTPTSDPGTTGATQTGSSSSTTEGSTAKGCDVRGGEGAPVLALVGLALFARRRRVR